jgi:insertion element IS1 protein InsB
MILTVKMHRCPNCGSIDMVKNGKDYKGAQKYECHNCGGYGTLEPQGRYTESQREQILRAYQERVSMRGIQRIFGVARQTLSRWLKEKAASLPDLANTLAPARQDDVLELDELWSFVLKKSNKRWVWLALCRRTRQIVAFYIGDRSEQSCKELWKRIPATYKSCITYSDFWAAYQKVFSAKTHRSSGQGKWTHCPC